MSIEKSLYAAPEGLDALMEEPPIEVALEDPESDTINNNVKLMYFRTPKDPNWTYEMINGNPIFNPSKSGFQDFEVGFEDKFSLIIKILKYAGLNVREADIVGAAVAMENANNLN
jgi:hypothetical protein